MARAASPQSGSGIRMRSQWDLNGGDECSSFPLLIASKSRQLSGEGYCVKAVCNRLLMQLCVCRQTRRSGMESLSSTLDHFTILQAHPGSSFGRRGWHHPSFQITPLYFFSEKHAAAILKKFMAARRAALLCEGNYGSAACASAESASD